MSTDTILVKPAEWKGQVPKKIMNERVLSKLSAQERAIVKDNHNAIDAVGLGLHVLGRLR